MFENTLIPSTRKRGTICVGYIIEGFLLALLVLIPLIHVQALPKSLISSVIVPPPPVGAPQRAAVTARPVHRPSLSETMMAPVTVPAVILPSRPEPEAPASAFVAGPPGAVPWGSENGVPGGFGATPLPAPPETPKPPRTSRITVGGVVEAARLIYEVKPEYPILARAARVQGTVRLEAIIDKDGSVERLHVLSGPPLLISSAMQAVARWRYQPTMLNGVAVEVSTEIDVDFTLNE
jgi:periplasmic protein TonB